MAARLSWPPIIAQAAVIVGSYTTPVTLRQVFYRLVAASLIPNTENAYNRLGRLTADARRAGTFPELADHTRSVDRPLSFDSPGKAIEAVAGMYHLDRTEGQERQVWVVTEKATLLSQVTAWTEDYGIPVVALRGYTSTPLLHEVARQVADDGRPSLVLYLGDHDPSGHDIERVFLDRCGFDDARRLAVTPTQVTTLGLAPNTGKVTDPRAKKFVATHGTLIQVEVEAIDPAVLEQIVTDAVVAEVDDTVMASVVEREEADRGRLRELADGED